MNPLNWIIAAALALLLAAGINLDGPSDIQAAQDTSDQVDALAFAANALSQSGGVR